METWQAGEPDKQEGDGTDATRLSDGEVARPAGSAAGRKRAAVEIVARHERSLKQTARRYSLGAEDAEDAYQRALEILLTKAPTDRLNELIRWTHTVVKHEAMAVRRNRERLLGSPPTPNDEEGADWIALIPAPGDEPDVRVERRERIARSREALQGLKPAELRALTLLAEGYSYAEIGRITGFSHTKVNRCLAEGRERFRRLLAHSEDGGRCTEIGPALSAFCDGETSDEEAAAIREHLRACASCRATMRAYRAAPGAAAALVPALPISRSLLERAHEAFSGITSKLPGAGTADPTVAQVATAGGTKGAGMAALTKLLAVCAGTAGGAAVCVATGVAPFPADLTPNHVKSPAIERSSGLVVGEAGSEGVDHEPAPPTPTPQPDPKKPAPTTIEAPQAVPPPPAEGTGAAEYTAPPPEPSPPTSEPASTPSAAGEFGP
ncbi:MAG TPA: sigma-70 family RNA polymerase sigma factor [Solirubrobacterales bacterium]|jgi:RNA polymerase sigma factor (sigma-70 family)